MSIEFCFIVFSCCFYAFFAGDLLHLAVKYHLPALTKHLEVNLARWRLIFIWRILFILMFYTDPIISSIENLACHSQLNQLYSNNYNPDKSLEVNQGKVMIYMKVLCLHNMAEEAEGKTIITFLPKGGNPPFLVFSTTLSFPSSIFPPRKRMINF